MLRPVTDAFELRYRQGLCLLFGNGMGGTEPFKTWATISTLVRLVNP